jgi:hypothetical protein
MVDNPSFGGSKSPKGSSISATLSPLATQSDGFDSANNLSLPFFLRFSYHG